MTQEPSPDSRPSEHSRAQVLVRRTVLAGRICVLLSALFLYLSKVVGADPGDSGDFLWSLFMMAARMCGLTSFAIGGVAIYNGRWTEGVLMMLLSVLLPVIAFVVYGTI